MRGREKKTLIHTRIDRTSSAHSHIDIELCINFYAIDKCVRESRAQKKKKRRQIKSYDFILLQLRIRIIEYMKWVYIYMEYEIAEYSLWFAVVVIVIVVFITFAT